MSASVVNVAAASSRGKVTGLALRMQVKSPDKLSCLKVISIFLLAITSWTVAVSASNHHKCKPWLLPETNRPGDLSGFEDLF